jgi:hypothetical protein
MFCDLCISHSTDKPGIISRFVLKFYHEEIENREKSKTLLIGKIIGGKNRK